MNYTSCTQPTAAGCVRLKEQPVRAVCIKMASKKKHWRNSANSLYVQTSNMYEAQMRILLYTKIGEQQTYQNAKCSDHLYFVYIIF